MDGDRAETLRRAAQRKTDAAERRVDDAIRQLVRAGEAINFRSVQRASGCSISYLYGKPEVRRRIEKLRDAQHTAQPQREQPPHEGTSSVVRTLTHQLNELRSRHQHETQELRDALAAAQGEILALRRQLGSKGRAA